MSLYKSLQYRAVGRDIRVTEPVYAGARPAQLDEPATAVMTDLKQTRAFSIEPSASINEANSKMIHCGVRLLFVLQPDSQNLAGLVTAGDILGEAPLKYLKEHGGTRQAVLVHDVMKPIERIKALRLSDVQRSQVGDIVETMQFYGHQHVLVLDDRSKPAMVCGIFSTTQIARQLGRPVEPKVKAESFAELEEQLVSAL